MAQLRLCGVGPGGLDGLGRFGGLAGLVRPDDKSDLQPLLGRQILYLTR